MRQEIPAEFSDASDENYIINTNTNVATAAAAALRIAPPVTTINETSPHPNTKADSKNNTSLHVISDSSFALLLAGGTAGAVSRTLTAPMDRLKVLLQAAGTGVGPILKTNSSSASGKAATAAANTRLFSGQVGVVDGLQLIHAQSGWKGFFRGNGANVVKVVPETGLKFFANDYFRRKLSKIPSQPTIRERFTAGALAGVVAQTAVYPLEIAKTRLALSAPGQFSSMADALASAVIAHGPTALYKGLVASVVGVIPYAGTDLAVYTFLRDSYIDRHPGQPLSTMTVLGCGAVSCTCGQLVAYPFQLIRTKLQAQHMPGMPRYDGIADCAKAIMKTRGVRGLYRGLVPNFLKAFPAITISYVVFEKSKPFWENTIANPPWREEQFAQ